MTSTEVIEEIGARLARAAPPKSRVLLFGSHARGTADDGSDFDVLVIEPTVESPISEAVRLRRELRGLGVPIDVVVMDEAKAKRRAGVRGTLLLRKAESDLAVARVLAADPDPHDDAIGFHAQQAVEKALKAVLASSRSRRRAPTTSRSWWSCSTSIALRCQPRSSSPNGSAHGL